MRIRKTTLKAVAVVVAVAVFVLVLDSTETHRRQWHCCALCRLVKIDDENILGRRWSEYEETELSEWYPQHVEAEHEHVWQRSTSSAGFNIFGRTLWVADSDRPAGITRWTPAEQIGIYGHVPDDEAKHVFLMMHDAVEFGGAHMDADTRAYMYSGVNGAAGILKEWVDSSFAASWDEIKADLSDIPDSPQLFSFTIGEGPAELPPPFAVLHNGTTIMVLFSVREKATHVSHESFEEMSRHPEIRTIELEGVTIDASGLPLLQRLPELRHLGLDAYNLKDQDLRHLAGLDALETLSISRSEVTDAGLEHLRACRRLRWICCFRSDVTPAGLRSLKQSLPELRVAYCDDAQFEWDR